LLRVDFADGPKVFLCPVVIVFEDGQWLLQSIKLGDPVTGRVFVE
jgi:hypothetical protein